MEHALQINTTPTGTEGILSLQGDLTMVHAQDTRKTLLEAIDKVDALRLDLNGVDSVDVSFVQLLCAAHRECFLSGKKILLQGNPTESIEEALERAGYTRQLGCIADARKSCLWAGPVNSIVISH